MRISITQPSINLYKLAGSIFILAGLVFNEWVLASLFSEDGILSPYPRFLIWTLDLLLIFWGCILVLQKDGKLLQWIGVAAVSVIAISVLAGYIIRMGYSFQIDYNEGWNVYHSIQAVSGQPLYADRQTMTPINYPPVSFFLVGGLGKLIHNILLAGRLISLASLLIVCGMCGGIVRILGGDFLDACFAGVFCLGILGAYARGYIAMNDPQMLGHALMSIGLLIYLKDRSKWMPVAILFCIAIFTKHNLLPVPFAVSVDILLRSRRDFVKWALAILAISGVLLVLILISLGSGFIDQLMASRGFDTGLITNWLTRLGFAPFITLLLTLPWLIQAAKNEQARIIPIFIAFSLVFGLYTAGGMGTDINIFFDFFIGISIAAGMSLWYLRSQIKIPDNRALLIYIVLPVILSFGILARSPRRIPLKGTFYMYNQMEQVFQEDANYLASKPGPVICSNILLCYAAGQDFTFDPFLVTEGIFSGRYQEDDIIKQLEAGYYPVVQLSYPLTDEYSEGLPYTSLQRSDIGFTENILRALASNYVLTRETIMGAFYEPRK